VIRDLSDPGAAAVIRRHRDYWHNQDEAVPGGGMPLFQFRAAQPLVPTPDPHYLEPPPPLDPTGFRDAIERGYDQHGLLADDLLRLVGTGITSEVLVGCRVAVRAGTHWAEPCFTGWDQLDRYRVQDTVWHQRLLENTHRALDAVDGQRYPFCCGAYRGAVDMAAAMLTAERLCGAVLDEPAGLKHLLARITDVTIETAVAHGRLLPRHQGGQFNSYGMWTPGRTVTFTTDAACLFSPAFYEEFFLPCDQRLCAAFETPFVHLHASSRQHFEAWAAIPHLGLQCVIDQAWLPEGRNQPIGPQLPELLDGFAAIRARKSLMLYGYWDEASVDLARARLRPGGSAITGMTVDPGALRSRLGLGDR
jgi:hypothetical protein